jgi:hypothetical protein
MNPMLVVGLLASTNIKALSVDMHICHFFQMNFFDILGFMDDIVEMRGGTFEVVINPCDLLDVGSQRLKIILVL